MKWVACVALNICLSVIGKAAPEKSGIEWCPRYPGSNLMVHLNQSFKSNTRDFIDALREADAIVTVHSTLRPEQRQYLMHWAWRIKKEDYWLETTEPCKGPLGERKIWIYPSVPIYSGDMAQGPVDIIWLWLDGMEFNVTLRNCSGDPDGHYHTGQHGEALAAAASMIDGYSLVYRPARHSAHNTGKAIDMTIQWSGDLTIAKKDGSLHTISTLPRNGNNPQLHEIGASYGVFKLVSDPPHWSSDGH